MPGGISLRSHHSPCSGYTVYLLFISFSFTAFDCCESNQQHTEQIGCDGKMLLFPAACFTSPDCDIYIHLYLNVSFYNMCLCMFGPISSSYMPTQNAPIPNLERVFLPHLHTPLGLYCVYPWCYSIPTRQTSRLPVMAAGWKREPDGLWACQIGRMY